MAKSFIYYRNIKGAVYASVCTPKKIKGKKDNQEQYLGRVIDKEKGIYRNRERGTFSYSLNHGYIAYEPMANVEERLILNFGDSYIINNILEK